MNDIDPNIIQIPVSDTSDSSNNENKKFESFDEMYDAADSFRMTY
jgi:hypothetical protein